MNPRKYEEMKDEQFWYFTFGSGQKYAGHYVKIKGTFSSARKEMFARFGAGWSFQYSEQEWADWCKNAMTYGCRIETELE